MDLSEKNYINISIYDINGKIVTELTDGYFNAGIYHFNWNGKNMNNREVSTGIYFYSVRSNRYKIVKRMVLMR